MGRKKVAAATAAVVTGMLIAVALATGAPGNDYSQRLGEADSNDLRAGPGMHGQAWATELFGRRYGRNLLAAVAAQPGDGQAAA
jgi:hypothetical protein